MGVAEVESYLGGPEDEPEAQEVLNELADKVDEEQGNLLADKQAELDEKLNEAEAKLAKLEAQQKFWTDGWEEMPESTMFDCTIAPSQSLTELQEIPVTIGNEQEVYKYKLRRGVPTRVPKRVLRQLKNCVIAGEYTEVIDGNPVRVEINVERFPFRALPVWN